MLSKVTLPATLAALLFAFTTLYAADSAGEKKEQVPVNPIVSAAAKSGVNRCLPRLNQISNFMTSGTQSGAFLFIPESAPDDNITSLSLEITTPGPVTTYGTATVAPLGEEVCNGLYEAVTYWPSSCLEVAMRNYKELKSAGPLKSGIQMLEGNDNMRVFLMEAGEGCVSIKKQVIY